MFRVQNVDSVQPHKAWAIYGARTTASVATREMDNAASNQPSEESLYLVCNNLQVTAGAPISYLTGPTGMSAIVSGEYGTAAGSRTGLHTWQQNISAGPIAYNANGITFSTAPSSASANGVVLKGVLSDTVLPVTGAVAWYDASDISSFTLSGSDVQVWRDKSPSDNHLAVASAGKEPARTGSQNGKSTVVLTGTDKVHNTAPPVKIGPTFAFTMCVVFKKTGANNSYEAFPIVCTSGNSGRPFDIYNSAWWLTSGMFTFTRPVQNATLWQQWTFIGFAPAADHTGGGVVTGQQYVDGVQLGTDMTQSIWSWSLDAQIIGMGSRGDDVTQFTGEVAEVVIYNRVLSTIERQQVEAYPKAKWGTP